jgi:nicotinate-nucleotide adenylyltransferase
VGHLVCAQEAYESLGLDVVVLVPVGQAPHRAVAGDPGAQVRAELCELVAASDPRIEVSRIEVDRPGPSFMADTLRLLAEDAPDDELVLVLGADQAAALGEWHEPERVLASATVAVAAREGMEREAVRRRVEPLAGHERMVFFDMPRIDVSSSLVRERVAAGRSIRYLVPDSVANRVQADRLYGYPTPAAAP